MKRQLVRLAMAGAAMVLLSGNTGRPVPMQGSQPADNPNAAKDFTLKDLTGHDVTLSSFRGKKVVIMDFWATWCGPCRMAMPSLARYWEKHKEQVEVLMINQGEAPERVKAFVDSTKLPMRVLLDRDGSVSRAYRVYGIPTTFIVDKEGVLRARHTGFDPNMEAKLEEEIAPLLK
jgi:peroxiredoxin